MISIPIRTGTIRLSQFLKLADIVGDGVEAKFLIQAGEIQVNGEKELRRGRKLRLDDRVEYAGKLYKVTEE